jgi:hypothetical protein
MGESPLDGITSEQVTGMKIILIDVDGRIWDRIKYKSLERKIRMKSFHDLKLRYRLLIFSVISTFLPAVVFGSPPKPFIFEVPDRMTSHLAEELCSINRENLSNIRMIKLDFHTLLRDVSDCKKNVNQVEICGVYILNESLKFCNKLLYLADSMYTSDVDFDVIEPGLKQRIPPHFRGNRIIPIPLYTESTEGDAVLLEMNDSLALIFIKEKN